MWKFLTPRICTCRLFFAPAAQNRFTAHSTGHYFARPFSPQTAPFHFTSEQLALLFAGFAQRRQNDGSTNKFLRCMVYFYSLNNVMHKMSIGSAHACAQWHTSLHLVRTNTVEQINSFPSTSCKFRSTTLNCLAPLGFGPRPG